LEKLRAASFQWLKIPILQSVFVIARLPPRLAVSARRQPFPPSGFRSDRIQFQPLNKGVTGKIQPSVISKVWKKTAFRSLQILRV
jgi:hypothetical protein